MRDRSRPALGLAVALGALLLAGCGSSSTPTTASSPSSSASQSGPTKAEFVAQAEGICRSLSAAEKPLEARQAALRGETNSSSAGAFVTIARQVVSLSEGADEKLHALPRPAADAAAIKTLLANYNEDVAYAKALAVAAAKQENDIGEAAERGLRASIASNSKLASEYGTKLCTGG